MDSTVWSVLLPFCWFPESLVSVAVPAAAVTLPEALLPFFPVAVPGGIDYAVARTGGTAGGAAIRTPLRHLLR